MSRVRDHSGVDILESWGRAVEPRALGTRAACPSHQGGGAQRAQTLASSHHAYRVGEPRASKEHPCVSSVSSLSRPLPELSY